MKLTRLGDRVFSRPAMLAEPPHKSRKAILNVLIALLLLIIASDAQAVVLIPAMILLLDFRSLVAMRDFSEIMKTIMQTYNALPLWVTLLSLFLFITITIAVLVFRVKIEKGTARSLGFVRKGAAAQYLIGLAAGVGIFALAVAIGVLTGALRLTAPAAPSVKTWIWIVLFFFGYLVQGMAEEALCRGFLLTALARRNNRLVAVVISSAFFAALHLFNPGLSLPAVLNLFLFGAFAALLVFKTGNLWMAAALHSAWNFAQGNLFGISVSGMAATPSVFRTEMTGAALWNGGAFGLEGGLCVTIVLVVGTALLALLPPKRE